MLSRVRGGPGHGDAILAGLSFFLYIFVHPLIFVYIFIHVVWTGWMKDARCVFSPLSSLEKSGPQGQVSPHRATFDRLRSGGA